MPLFAFFTIWESVNQTSMKDYQIEHQMLLDVIKDGNTKKIERAAREHILSGWYPPEYKL